uniref:Uncharacterized protein n=1 Tax=Rhizophora mucronata TaxID=61149 RepID=A0A2P2R2T2_RHIMU
MLQSNTSYVTSGLINRYCLHQNQVGNMYVRNQSVSSSIRLSNGQKTF